MACHRHWAQHLKLRDGTVRRFISIASYNKGSESNIFEPGGCGHLQQTFPGIILELILYSNDARLMLEECLKGMVWTNQSN